MPHPTSRSFFAGEAVEIDDVRQVAELVEPVLIEIRKKLRRARSVLGHLQVVDTLVPIGLNASK